MKYIRIILSLLVIAIYLTIAYLSWFLISFDVLKNPYNYPNIDGLLAVYSRIMWLPCFFSIIISLVKIKTLRQDLILYSFGAICCLLLQITDFPPYNFIHVLGFLYIVGFITVYAAVFGFYKCYKYYKKLKENAKSAQ